MMEENGNAKFTQEQLRVLLEEAADQRDELQQTNAK